MSSVEFDAQAGARYQIALGDWDGAAGAVNLGIALMPPPNDAFADRQVIVGRKAFLRGTTSGTHREFGEPLHAGRYGGRSVWYSWTAPETGEATVTLSTGFNGLLGIYEGPGLHALMPVAEAVTPWPVSGTATFTAQQGHAYQIAVDGVIGEAGNYDLEINMPSGQQTELRITQVDFDGERIRLVIQGVGPVGASVLHSTNLVDWVPLSTISAPAAGDEAVFEESVPSGTAVRFYRVVAQPPS
jgi:hypothetical protein